MAVLICSEFSSGLPPNSWQGGRPVGSMVVGSHGCRGSVPMPGALSSLSRAIPSQTEQRRLQMEMVQLLPVERMPALRPR